MMSWFMSRLVSSRRGIVKNAGRSSLIKSSQSRRSTILSLAMGYKPVAKFFITPELTASCIMVIEFINHNEPCLAILHMLFSMLIWPKGSNNPLTLKLSTMAAVKASLLSQSTDLLTGNERPWHLIVRLFSLAVSLKEVSPHGHSDNSRNEKS